VDEPKVSIRHLTNRSNHLIIGELIQAKPFSQALPVILQNKEHLVLA
jgi:hypothetical protein